VPCVWPKTHRSRPMMPKRLNHRHPGQTGNGRKSTARGGAASASSLGGMSSASADTIMAPGDTRIQPPSRTFNLAVPRNYLSQVHWLRGQRTVQYTLNTSAVTQMAVSFGVGDLTLSSALIDLFDQYALAEVVWTATHNSGDPVQLVSAVSFDSSAFSTPPVTFDAVQQYSTSLYTVLQPGKSMTRVVRPCLNVPVNTGFSPFAVERLWLDSAVSSAQHYGILALAGIVPTGATIEVTKTYVIACRNNF